MSFNEARQFEAVGFVNRCRGQKIRMKTSELASYILSEKGHEGNLML